MRSSLIFLVVLFVGCNRVTDSPPPHAAKAPSTNNLDDTTSVSPDSAQAQLDPNSSEGRPKDDRPNQASNDDPDIASPAERSEQIAVDAKDVKRESVPQQPPGEVEIITFDDLNIGMPADAKFREILLEYNDGRAKSLFGKRINVAGYMNATDTLKGVKEFILLRNLECKFGPGGQADHLVHVLMQGDAETEFTDQVVYVEGVLELKEFPEDGPSTWSIYDLKCTKVSTRPPPRRR